MNESDPCPECHRGTLKTELNGLYRYLICDRCSATFHHPDEIKAPVYATTKARL